MMKERKSVSILGILLFAVAVVVFTPSDLLAKNHKVVNTVMKYEDASYSVDVDYFFGSYFAVIRNTSNKLENELRYKVGSNPLQYYTFETGMGHYADVDQSVLNNIINDVFTKTEIDNYTNADGFIHIRFVVDPLNGKILEVIFEVHTKATIFVNLLSLDKIYKMENLFKEKLTCSISKELEEEKQSYALASVDVFRKHNL